MLDKIRDFFKRDEDFSERLKDSKNPFLGTLSLIWVIRNWQIVYAIFFDNREFLVRLEFIKGRISASTFGEILIQIGINVGLALLAIIVIYLFVYLTRYITNKFENSLLPWIYEKSAPKRIVLKTTYDELNKDVKNLETKLEKEREKRIAAEAEIERIETKERDKTLAELSSEKMESIEYENGIQDEEKGDEDSIEIEKIFNAMYSKHEEKDLKTVFDMVLNGYEFSSSNEHKKLVEELVRKDLLAFESKKNIGGRMHRTYVITKRGRHFLDQFL